MTRVCIAILCCCIPAWTVTQDKPPVKHGEACPGKCQECTAALKKALDYLVSQQQEDGSFPASKAPIRYVRTDRDVVTVMTAAVCALALQAHGGYPDAVSKVRGYLKGKLEEILAVQPQRAGSGGGPIYSAALGFLFFLHLHEAGKDAAARGMCESLVKYLVAAIGTEVGKSCWKKGRDEGTVWFISGVTALTNLTVVALGRARGAGFAVPEKSFEVARGFYRTTLLNGGSFKYDQHDMFPHEPRYGRCINALLALKVLGDYDDAAYVKSIDYARKHIDHPMTHHTPSLTMSLAAYTFHAMGKEDWARFAGIHFEKLIARQKPEGNLDTIADYDKKLMMTPNDLAWGKCYATAHFALMLQVGSQKVKFYVPSREY